MTGRSIVAALLLVVGLGGIPAPGQTSSIGARNRQAKKESSTKNPPQEPAEIKRNLVYETYSWTATPHTPPKTFKVNDLITIIVRERTKFEADAELKTKKDFDIKSELGAFIKPIDGGLGATTFLRGKPNIDYRFSNNRKNKADAAREDKLTTRVTGKIIDVKPNGLLVLEARRTVIYDEETSEICITGVVRKEDVTADNTVLSTQIAEATVKVNNEGALRDHSSRGWIPRLIDLLKPF